MITRLIISLLLINSLLKAEEKQIKIGVSVDLTGVASQWGEDQKDAFLFAKEDLDLHGLELQIEDDQCDNRKALSVANKFVEIDRVDLVIGFTCSNVVHTTAPIYARGQIPMMVSSASSPEVTRQVGEIFRTTPSDALIASKLAKYLADQKYSLVATLNNQSDYAQDLKKYFLKDLESYGVQSVNIDYNPGQVDFRTHLLKLNHARPQAIFLNPISVGDFLQMVRQLKSLSWDIPIIAAYHPGSKIFLDQAKELASGLIFADFAPLESILNAEGKGLMKRYYAKGYQVRGLDSVVITSYEILRLIKIANAEGLNITELLKSKRQFTGSFGNYSFDSEGDIQGLGFVIKQIKNGVPELLE